MLSPTPLPLSLLRNGHHHNQKGLIVKLLPEVKQLNQQATHPENLINKIRPGEKEIYELRESFSIDFNFSQLANWRTVSGNFDSDQLLYLVAAFGSVQNYETFITLSSLRSSALGNFQDYHHQAIYIALKYRNFKLISYFLKYMKIYEKRML